MRFLPVQRQVFLPLLLRLNNKAKGAGRDAADTGFKCQTSSIQTYHDILYRFYIAPIPHIRCSKLASEGFQSLLIYETKVFQTLAPDHHQQPSRTLIQLQCHVSASCHFISVMTHRFSIYATNCIASGCRPNQSQLQPSVHLGKPRSLRQAAGKSFLFPTPTKQD